MASLRNKPNKKQPLHVQIALGAKPKPGQSLSQGVNKKTVNNYKK